MVWLGGGRGGGGVRGGGLGEELLGPYCLKCSAELRWGFLSFPDPNLSAF